MSTSTRHIQQLAALALTAIAGTACGADSGVVAADNESNLVTTQQAYADYLLLLGTGYHYCATEWGNGGNPDTCHLGKGGKYVAFGATDSSGFPRYNYKYFPAGDVRCSNDSFPGQADPVPGVIKSCYFTNLSRVASEGAQFTPYGVTGAVGTVQIVYGSDGAFTAPTKVSAFGRYTCNTATFGSAGGSGSRACYQLLVGYHWVADDGGTFTVSANGPVPAVYGSGGLWYFATVSGTVSCWGGAFGSMGTGPGRSCYVMDLGDKYLASENQSFSMARGSDSYPVLYTSGHNGNAILRNLRYGTCNNATFTDPHWGSQKYCYGTGLIR